MSQYLNFGGHFENGRPKICSALYLEVPTRSFFHLYPSDDESTEKPCSQNYGHGGPDIQYTNLYWRKTPGDLRPRKIAKMADASETHHPLISYKFRACYRLMLLHHYYSSCRADKWHCFIHSNTKKVLQYRPLEYFLLKFGIHFKSIIRQLQEKFQAGQCLLRDWILSNYSKFSVRIPRYCRW